MTTLVVSDWHLPSYHSEWQHQLARMATRADVLLVLGDVGEAEAYLKLLSEVTRVVVVQGNHDKVPLCLDIITWINVPIRGDWIKGLPKHSLLLPHVHDYRRDWAGLNFEGLNWVFTHNRFDIIPASIFPQSTQIISGDIHTPQTVGNVTYVGAPHGVPGARMLVIDDNGYTVVPFQFNADCSKR